jgi:hypothetical protein
MEKYITAAVRVNTGGLKKFVDTPAPAIYFRGCSHAGNLKLAGGYAKSRA